MPGQANFLIATIRTGAPETAQYPVIFAHQTELTGDAGSFLPLFFPTIVGKCPDLNLFCNMA